MTIKSSAVFFKIFSIASLVFFLSACSSPNHKRGDRINISHYQDNKENVFAYSPNLIAKLQEEIDFDNQLIREYRAQMLDIDDSI